MKKIISFFILFSLVACNGKGGSSASASSDNSKSPVQNETVATEFLKLVNNHRKSIGLKALVNADEMVVIAAEHSADMANKSVAFGHTGFSGRCSEARVKMGGGNLCAENVAMGQKTAQAVFTSWMNSSSHRANIENSRLTHSGLGTATSSSGTIYWTHLFLEL
ncbi:MAG: CAP domain-containing protein [Bdellovibrionota bacterium]